MSDPIELPIDAFLREVQNAGEVARECRGDPPGSQARLKKARDAYLAKRRHGASGPWWKE